MADQDLTRWLTTLSPADRDAVDALLGQHAAAGLKLTSESATSVEPARLERARKLLALIGRCPAEDASDELVTRTLAAVHDARQRHRFAQQVEALTAPPVAFRWSEMIAVAAVMMICVSLVWPMLARSRDTSRREACANNLRLSGTAVQRYAMDHQGYLPIRQNLGDVWWQVGADADPSDTTAAVRSNTANLAPLWQKQYLNPNVLACPDNAFAARHMSASVGDFRASSQTSYSYQNQWAGPIRLRDVARTAILADRNPLIQVAPDDDDPTRLTFQQDADLPVTAVSRFHGSDGQNVLLATGDVIWTPEGRLPTGDRIWVPDKSPTDETPYRYTGSDKPTTTADSMLVP